MADDDLTNLSDDELRNRYFQSKPTNPYASLSDEELKQRYEQEAKASEAEANPGASAQEAYEVGAKRFKRQVMPEGGRQEGVLSSPLGTAMMGAGVVAAPVLEAAGAAGAAGRGLASMATRSAPFALGAASAKGADWARDLHAPEWVIKFLQDYSLGNILKGTEGRK